MARRTTDPNTIGTLRTNEKGVWYVHWSERGRSCRESCKTKDAAEARRYLKEWREEIRNALTRGQRSRTPTVEELCRHWLEQAELKGQAETGRHVLRQIRQYFGNDTCAEITVARQRDYRQARGVKASTLRRELGALKTVVRRAAEDGLIEASTLPRFEPVSIVKPVHAPMSKAEVIYFWDQAIAWGRQPRLNPRARDVARRVMLIACLGLETGARREAIHQLTWDRVNFDERQIDYRVPGRRETKKRRVVSHITDRLLPVLQEAAGWAGTPKGPDGRPVGPVLGDTQLRTTFRAFRAFAAAIGMPRVTPHLMRHSLATLMSQNGTPVQEIAEVLGNTPKVTMENYLHHTPDRLRQAVNNYLGTTP